MNSQRMSRRRFLRTIAVTAMAVGAAGLAGYTATRAPAVATPAISFTKEASMSKCFLVTYATRAGSTAEIATAIGETLSARGFRVDVMPVKAKPSLSGYDAVILCSAIRMSAWLGEMVEFVKANQAALKNVPVAFVTAHILNTGDDEASRAARLAYTASVRQMLSPVDEVFLAGKIDYSTLSFLDRLLAKAVEQQTGTPPGDYRNWDAIRAWANGVLAEKL